MIETIGQRLKNERIAHGYSQDYVAKKIDIDQKTYSNYERDICTPKIVPMIKLADLYGVTLNYLAGLET